MTAHSDLGASSMYRWSACPGSVRLCRTAPDRSSSYAEEGTLAHDIAAKWLTSGRGAIDDDEMSDAIDEYLNTVDRFRLPMHHTLHIEQRFDLSKVYPGCFGTVDAVVWQPVTKHLVVIDFKYGAGIPVEVVGNTQLRYYGLGAMLSLGYPAEKVTLVIVQPRCEHRDGPVRSETISADELLEFGVELYGYARRTEDPDAPLVPGEHCRFCNAAPLCPKLKADSLAAAKAQFAKGEAYDPVELAAALSAIPAIEAWIKSVREFAYAEAERGAPPPGFKLVAKRPQRKWGEDMVGLLEELRGLGLKDADIYEPSEIRSPAQIEKLVGKRKLDDYIVSESSGHALAPENDPRPAVGKGDEFRAL